MMVGSNNNSLVSIVLPVYNGEKYLVRAIESILTQSYKDWELLLVNDGSIDNTIAICDEYVAKDSRIKAFHQLNVGVNSARAKGVDNAMGYYLTFLDADDAFYPDALEYMVKQFIEEVDLLVCGRDEILLKREQYIESLWQGKAGFTLWGKMFKTSLYRQMNYAIDRRIVMGEDLLLNSMYALNVNMIKMVERHVYLVNHNNESSVTKTFKHNWEYEKYYFSEVEKLFLCKCKSLSNYREIQLLFYKCFLNAMKYVMLDGGKINYRDTEFIEVNDFFNHNKNKFGPSERLVIRLKNHWLYRSIMKIYIKRIANKKR